MGRISPGPTRWPLGAEERLVPGKSNLKPQTAIDFCLVFVPSQCQDIIQGFGCNLKLGILIDPVLSPAGTVSERCFEFAISGFVWLCTLWGFDSTNDRINTM